MELMEHILRLQWSQEKWKWNFVDFFKYFSLNRSMHFAIKCSQDWPVTNDKVGFGLHKVRSGSEAEEAGTSFNIRLGYILSSMERYNSDYNFVIDYFFFFRY